MSSLAAIIFEGRGRRPSDAERLDRTMMALVAYSASMDALDGAPRDVSPEQMIELIRRAERAERFLTGSYVESDGAAQNTGRGASAWLQELVDEYGEAGAS